MTVEIHLNSLQKEVHFVLVVLCLIARAKRAKREKKNEHFANHTEMPAWRTDILLVFIGHSYTIATNENQWYIWLRLVKFSTQQKLLTCFSEVDMLLQSDSEPCEGF